MCNEDQVKLDVPSLLVKGLGKFQSKFKCPSEFQVVFLSTD